MSLKTFSKNLPFPKSTKHLILQIFPINWRLKSLAAIFNLLDRRMMTEMIKFRQYESDSDSEIWCLFGVTKVYRILVNSAKFPPIPRFLNRRDCTDPKQINKFPPPRTVTSTNPLYELTLCSFFTFFSWSMLDVSNGYRTSLRNLHRG